MKKILFVSSLLAVCALTLAACGSDKTDTSEEAAEVETEESPDTVEEETSEEIGLGGDEIRTSDTVFVEVELEETELYNADGITVTATGFDANADFGPEIAIRVTNESDTVVDVIAEDVSVNGYMMDPGLLYVVVSPGETAESEITLYNFDLDARGIDTVATVSLSIAVMDDETYTEIGSGDPVTLTTSAADYTQSVDDNGTVLYDADGILVVSQGLRQDDIWPGDLVLYVENNTDQYIGVTGLNITVNGQEEEDMNFWADLTAGTRAVTGMYLLDIEDLDLDSIDDVREISFTLQIIDQDAWEELDRSDEILLTFD